MRRVFLKFKAAQQEKSYINQQISLNAPLLIPFHVMTFLTTIIISFQRFSLLKTVTPQFIFSCFVLPLWFPLSIPLARRHPKIWDSLLLFDVIVLTIYICFLNSEFESNQALFIQGFSLSSINLLLHFRVGSVGNYMGSIASLLAPLIVHGIDWSTSAPIWPLIIFNLFLLFFCEKASREVFLKNQ